MVNFLSFEHVTKRRNNVNVRKLSTYELQTVLNTKLLVMIWNLFGWIKSEN